jgi:hypothetical protein
MPVVRNARQKRRMKANLEFFPFSESRPNDNKDCLYYLLCFNGWQYDIVRWGAEKQMFYDESGDYIEDQEFLFAELPILSVKLNK